MEWSLLPDSNRLPPEYKTGLHHQSLEGMKLVGPQGFEPWPGGVKARCAEPLHHNPEGWAFERCIERRKDVAHNALLSYQRRSKFPSSTVVVLADFLVR